MVDEGGGGGGGVAGARACRNLSEASLQERNVFGELNPSISPETKKKLLTHNTERLRGAAARHREVARNRSGYLTAAAENQ